MTKRLMQLAMLVAGCVLLVASVDYQRLMGREHVAQQVRGQLAQQVVAKFLKDFPEVAKRGASIGSVQFDFDTVIVGALRRALRVEQSATTSDSALPMLSLRVPFDGGGESLLEAAKISGNRQSEVDVTTRIVVDGQIEEWVVDPLPAARLVVALRASSNGEVLCNRRYTVKATDEGLTLEPLSARLPWWQQAVLLPDFQASPNAWFWMVLALVLPWMALEGVFALVRKQSWLMCSVLALGYLAAVVWSARELMQHFDQQRGLWLMLVLGSCWVLMHFDDQPVERADESSLHRSA